MQMQAANRTVQRTSLPPSCLNTCSRPVGHVFRNSKQERKRYRIRLHCRASLKEQAAGVDFPEVAQFWEGEKCRCLGAGVRVKRVAFVGVKVYAVALYVEGEKAARELGIRDRGGFFADAPDDDYTTAIADGAFLKVLQVQLLRKVDGKTFYEALEETLAPRLRITGDSASLKTFGAHFEGRSLEKGTDVVMLWRPEGILEVVVGSNSHDYSKASSELQIESPQFCRALFEVFLGGQSVVPDARRNWAAGTRLLLDSERVRRDTRPGGFG